MNAIYAFILNTEKDWRVSEDEDWNLDLVEPEDPTKVLGHRKINGSIHKVYSDKSGKLFAIAK